jgi:diacylglycerol kinase family enzyme
VKRVFILNPGAGRARHSGKYKAWNARIRRQFPQAPIVETVAIEDVPALCQHWIDQSYTQLVMVGGDGFINACLPVLARHPAVSLGIIPIGTGCDFYRSINHGKRDPLKVLRDNRQVLLPIGTIHADGGAPRFFCNSVSFGVTTEVLARKNNMPRLIPVGLHYFVATLLSLPGRKSISCAFFGDLQRQVQPYLAALICNGSFIGGGMQISPASWVRQQGFSVLTINPMGLWTILANIKHLYSGGLEQLPLVQVTTVKRLDFEFENPIPLECDGELIRGKRITIDLAPHRIQVVGSIAELPKH